MREQSYSALSGLIAEALRRFRRKAVRSAMPLATALVMALFAASTFIAGLAAPFAAQADHLDDEAAITFVKSQVSFATIANGNAGSQQVTGDLNLMTTDPFGEGVSISWASDDTSRLENDGTVHRTATDAYVMFTATYSKNATSTTELFGITILGDPEFDPDADANAVAAAAADLDFADIANGNPDADNVTGDLELIATGTGGVMIAWESDTPSVIATDGTVTRQETDAFVLLTATLTSGAASDTKQIGVLVLGTGEDPLTDQEAVDAALAALGWDTIKGGNATTSAVTLDLDLVTTGAATTSIAWESSATSSIATDGTVTRGAADAAVTLTATVSRGAESGQKDFTVTVLQQTTLVGDGTAVTPASLTPGMVEFADGIITLLLGNGSFLDVSGATTTVSGSAITNGDLTNASTTQTVGGQTVLLETQVAIHSGVDGEALAIVADDAIGATASIPDGTTVYASSSWDGTILPPAAATSTVTGAAPSGFQIGDTVIEVGSPDAILLFDRPVRITIPNADGPVGYRAAGSGTWVTIATACDSATAPTNLTFPGECAIASGSDTVIWTYHFTAFGELETAADTGGGSNDSDDDDDSSSSSGGGGGGGGSTPLHLLQQQNQANQNSNNDNTVDGDEDGGVVLGEQASPTDILVMITTDAALIVQADANLFADSVNATQSTSLEAQMHTRYTTMLLAGTTIGAEAEQMLTLFITYGTPASRQLGAGERAGVVNSYKAAFGHLPANAGDWEDVLKIANGRWPGELSPSAEQRALSRFAKVYDRMPDRANAHDDAAITIIAYGLRPLPRNLNSERAAIRIFTAIYGKAPQTAVEWDIVRAIAYSGATR